MIAEAQPVHRQVPLLIRRPALLGASLVLLVSTLAALFAGLVAPFPPEASNFQAILVPPGTPGYLLGTDDLGRDVLSRLIWGARASMQAGVLSTLIAVAVSVPLGLLAGFYRGTFDSVLMRLTDAMLAFPYLIIAVGLAVILGPSLMNATIAIGLTQIPKLLRVTRAEVLNLREEAFVHAAFADGASDATIMFRHILPNITNTLLVQATVIIPFAIIGEAGLSFLGLGVQPPNPSWGVMLTNAQAYLDRAAWLALLPGAAIFISTLAFNVLGDQLRDLHDPKFRR